MALISWSSMLSTGISEQDTQHKKLIDLINQLNDAMQAGHGNDIMGKVLSELVNYTVFHFGYEEKLMAQHKYEDTPAHKACLLYTSPSPRDGLLSRMPSSA